MTQKMIAAEALLAAKDIKWHDHTNASAPEQVPQGEAMLLSLKLMGFVVIPIEPDDDVLERMARARTAETVRRDATRRALRMDLSEEYGRAVSRAAYAAIVTAPSSEK